MPFAATLREVDQLRDVNTRLERLARSMQKSPRKVAFMNASIFFGLLIVLFTILIRHRMRKLKPQITGFRSQRMCPSCGLITSRLRARCLECGVASFSER
jgi:hypothetical protein